MKKIVLLIIAVLFLIPQLSLANKIFFKKYKKTIQEKKIHPLEKFFNKPPQSISKSNKLLCILIDFQKDDNPQTTGTGKFLTQKDAENYPVTLGKPPHDYSFFLQQLKALKYYYIAASFGALNLDYEIFPKPSSGKVAYTLPHEMAYYNPPNASQDLMISRFEEYFHDIFTQADKDEAIHFADYGHYLVIHAGSDWQHDIVGDSPSDIPSFFIRVSDDKKVWVDNHTFAIDHTCNVPEMITQDIQVYENNDSKEIYGYGVINAVLAHEFGHSLGFVDLYSTTNYRPGVGFFDIMDSGGSGLLGIQDENAIYYIEGGLPVLPSAWHRILAWEDNFRARGILKDYSELPFDQDIVLNPAEKPVSSFGVINPYFVKIPISKKEYILLENRQVDPDGDGGTAVKSTSDKRVILYPIHFNDNPSDTLATYEYDFLLPGWITESGRYIGGGILAWHIDDKIIYDEGNYDTNTVNSTFYHRGVRLIEADNINDIGNIYSRFWLGTQNDPYYRYKPIIQNGYFIGWNDQISTDGEELGIFNKTLSSSSKPALITNDNRSSNKMIYEISSYAIGHLQERTMSFRLGINGFENSYRLNFENTIIKKIGKINKIGLISNEDFELPVITSNGFTVYSFVGNQWMNFNLYNSENLTDVSVIDYYDNTQKYVLTEDKKIILYDMSPISEFSYSDTISEKVIYIKETNEFMVPTSRKLYIGADSLNYPNSKCYYNSKELIVLSEGKIYFLDSHTHNVLSEFIIPHYTRQYELVTFVDTLNNRNSASFLINKKNEILKITENGVEKIFSIKNYTSEQPTQLSLYESEEGSIYLAFGAGNRIFSISLYGDLQLHFPTKLDNFSVIPYSFPKIIKQNNETFIMLNANNYVVSVSTQSGYYNKENSMIMYDDFEYSTCNEKFALIQKISAEQIIISIKDLDNSKVFWSGERNNNYSVYYGEQKDYSSQSDVQFTGFAFPNPAKGNFVKFRVFNALGDITLSIYDVSAAKIYYKKFSLTGFEYQDLEVNIENYSSGVYFAIVKSKNKTVKIPFGIEK